MLEEAGIGVAYHPQYVETATVADKVIEDNCMAPLLDIAQASPERVNKRWPTKSQALNIGLGSLAALATAGLVYLAVRQVGKVFRGSPECDEKALKPA